MDVPDTATVEVKITDEQAVSPGPYSRNEIVPVGPVPPERLELAKICNPIEVEPDAVMLRPGVPLAAAEKGLNKSNKDAARAITCIAPVSAQAVPG